MYYARKLSNLCMSLIALIQMRAFFLVEGDNQRLKEFHDNFGYVFQDNPHRSLKFTGLVRRLTQKHIDIRVNMKAACILKDEADRIGRASFADEADGRDWHEMRYAMHGFLACARKINPPIGDK